MQATKDELPSRPALADPVTPIHYEYLTYATDLSAWMPKEEGVGEEIKASPHSVWHSFPSLSQFDDPQSWSPGRKAFVTWLSCSTTFVTTYTPGAYAAGRPQYKDMWGLSDIAVYAGITLFTLLFAVTPMFLASFSELMGRRPLFLTAGVIYVVSQIGSGVTASFAGLLVTRALAGISCSVFSTVVGGVLSDMYAARDRNTPMAIFSGAALLGTGIGPLVSGVITEHISWRWIYYVQTISCGLVVLALFAFFPETRGSVLLSRKAKALNAWCESVGDLSPFGHLRWKVLEDERRTSAGLVIKTSLVRPIHLLFTESVVFWFSLWMSFAWSILYLTFEVVPLIFERAYQFSAQGSGLVFTATAVASVIGTGAAILQERIVTSPTSRFSKLALKGQPEARLVFACVQSLLLPAGLFWLGATARPSIPFIVPAISIATITLGIFSVYLAVFNYLADSYHAYASSAIAAQSFTRNVFAAFLPLAAKPLLDSRLGIIGTGSLLGGIGLLLSAVPWVLVLWGPRIRKRSRLASVESS
ncbi:MFS general substrate transporter [Ustulina deusta]|nr:MFS general substrate transporter [Ustulina deusta]KAI3334643.1 MFS general substrate transporter [Ustulina deusta]